MTQSDRIARNQYTEITCFIADQHPNIYQHATFAGGEIMNSIFLRSKPLLQQAENAPEGQS
jgi:hypothetical protein